MKIALLIALAVFPCLAAEVDEELVRKVVEHMERDSMVKDKTRTFLLAPAALKFIEGAEKIVVFEGLPHQHDERTLLDRERARVDETKIGGFAFYPQPHNLTEKDEPALRKRLLIFSGFEPFHDLKLCGDFHPDYAIRFTKGEEHCDFLLCFGCGDGRILHDGKVIHCHLRGGWSDLLAGYAKHRPKPDR